MTTAHFVSYCEHCERQVVICGKCGNNTCNGGYGTLPDGSTCDACPEAYEVDREQSLLDD